MECLKCGSKIFFDLKFTACGSFWLLLSRKIRQRVKIVLQDFGILCSFCLEFSVPCVLGIYNYCTATLGNFGNGETFLGRVADGGSLSLTLLALGGRAAWIINILQLFHSRIYVKNVVLMEKRNWSEKFSTTTLFGLSLQETPDRGRSLSENKE